MKKIIILFCSLFITATNVFSQQESTSNIDYASSDKTPDIIILENQMSESFNYWNQEFEGHWSGIYMGLNGLANSDYSMYNEENSGFLDNELLRSNSLNLNILQASIGFQHNRNTIGMVTGLGLEINTYYLNRNISIKNGFNCVEPVELYFDDNQKSKLSLSYLDIPILFEFQIPSKTYGKRFYIAIGAIAKIRLNSYTKLKYRQESQKLKLKTPDSYYINDITLATTLRIGWGGINLFFNYDIQPLFEKDKGPIVHPYSFGLALLSF